MKQENGLTLVELLITLAVVAVVIAIGVPGLNQYAENNRSTAQVNLVSGTMSLARSEAIKRGMNVVVCASNTTTSSSPKCSNSNTWETGWLVFADPDGNGAYDTSKANDVLLAVNEGLKSGLTMSNYSVKGSTTTKNSSISFKANGSVVEGQNTFKICTQDDSSNKTAPATHARALNIGNVGLIRLATDTDGDHVVNDISGSNVTCP